MADTSFKNVSESGTIDGETITVASAPKYMLDLDAISDKIKSAVEEKDIVKYKDAYNEQYNTVRKHLLENQPDFPPQTIEDVSDHINYILGMFLVLKSKHEVEECETSEIIAKLMHRIEALEREKKGEAKCSMQFSL